MTIRTIVFLFVTGSVFGQTAIPVPFAVASEQMISDTINHSPNRDFEKRIGLGPIDSGSFDFEVRFYKLKAVTNQRNLRLIRSTAGYNHVKWKNYVAIPNMLPPYKSDR